MVVCQFFLRGQCKFGERCRNEHPADAQRQGGSTNQTWTANANSLTTNVALAFTLESMTKDFTPQADKPLWPLSSYGPAKHETNLISNLDESPEELRVRAVAAIKAGAVSDYLKHEMDKIIAADQIYNNARSHTDQAYNQAKMNASSNAPSHDSTSGRASGFGTGSQQTASAFGQPSAFGALSSNTASAPSAFGGGPLSSALGTTAPTSVFGKPAFGQPAFGQPPSAGPSSAFSQPSQSTSAFVQPQSTSVFGQTSQPASSIIKPATGAFGSVGGSAFGAPTSTPSAFGNTGASGGGGGFAAFAGQPSTFGLAASNATNAPASTGGSVFGQPSLQNAPAPTSAFGAPAQGSSGFGAPSAFGTQPPVTSSVFGGGSAFAPSAGVPAPAPAPNPGSAFGPGGNASASAFSNISQTPSPFGAQSQNQPTTSAFPSIFGPSSQQPSVFGSSFIPEHRRLPSESVSSQPPTSFQPQPAPPSSGDKKKSSYKPGFNFYDQFLPDNYIDLIPQEAREAFTADKFEFGKVPQWVPPKELR